MFRSEFCNNEKSLKHPSLASSLPPMHQPLQHQPLQPQPLLLQQSDNVNQIKSFFRFLINLEIGVRTFFSRREKQFQTWWKIAASQKLPKTCRAISETLVQHKQCDQIWRNFITYATFKQFLAISLVAIQFLGKLRTCLGKYFLHLGNFSQF